MSEIRRVGLHSAPRGRKEKGSPASSVRLNVELGASNEDQYPEISYRDLVAGQLKDSKSAVRENGTTPHGLDPFTDNEEDVARIASQFEKKYGGQSSYAQCKRTKRSIDEFADIGAGYDENDSFIDNTDGYDEMCPPGYDTFHGGFYINCGSLEFKNVQHDGEEEGEEPRPTGSNKRRISSSTEMESSSDSSSESSCKERALNGDDDKKRRKQIISDGKNKSKKLRTEASSAPTSGKQTSDDNAHSADSRTSHTEDSLTSKPAPSSENAATSDSSRDAAPANPQQTALPPVVQTVLDELTRANPTSVPPRDITPHAEHYILRLEQSLDASSADVETRKAAWLVACRLLGVSRARLLRRARELARRPHTSAHVTTPSSTATTKIAEAKRKETEIKPKELEVKPKEPEVKRKEPEIKPKDTEVKQKEPEVKQKQPEVKQKEPEVKQKEPDVKQKEVKPREPKAMDTSEPLTELTPEQKEEHITAIIERLKAIIETMKPSMIMTYKAECERVQEENKKIALANASSGTKQPERRLPKRRYPWCMRMRQQLAALVRLCSAEGQEAAARLLAHRVLPLFPPGFVRLPTLLRQADLNKDLKVVELKKQRIPTQGRILEDPRAKQLAQQMNFASKSAEKPQGAICSATDDVTLNGKLTKSLSDVLPKTASMATFNRMYNSFNLAPGMEVYLDKSKSADTNDHKSIVTIEKVETNKISPEKVPKTTETEKYNPPNSIGSITITPVSQPQKFDPKHQASKLANNTVTVLAKGQTDSKIRVKSPAEIMKAANISKEDKPVKSKNEPKLPNTLQIKSLEKLHDSKHVKQQDKSNEPKPPSTSRTHDKPKEQKLPNTLVIKPPDRKSPVPMNVKTQEKRSSSPLRIDTSHPKKPEIIKTHSPIFRQSNGEKSENNLPRPGLIHVQHSPTFARPADKKSETKSKDVVVLPEIDPLSDVLQVDDSSSDVELIEETIPKADPLTTSEMKPVHANTVIAQTSKEALKDTSVKTDDKQKKDKPSEKKEDSNHKHRGHKREHSSSRPEKNHCGPPSEKIYKSDVNSKTDLEKNHSEQRRDSSHPRSDSKYREKEKDSKSPMSSNKSDHHKSVPYLQVKNDSVKELSAEKFYEVPIECDTVSNAVIQEGKRQQIKQQDRKERQSEGAESETDIEKVLRDLRDLQNSQEPHYNSEPNSNQFKG